MMKFPEKIFNTTSATVMVLHTSGEIIWVNNAFVGCVGYCLDDLKSATRWPFLAKDYQEQFLSHIRRATSGKPPQSFDTPVVCLDGIIKTVRWNTLLINNKPRQETVAVLGITIENSEQKEAELKELAAIVRHSSELVNLADFDGNMVFLNEAGGKILGIDQENVKNVNILEVIPDHLKTLVEKELLPALSAGTSWEGDLQYVNLKTGKLTDVHALTFTVDDPDTSCHKYMANISVDITERKKTEKILQENEERLCTITSNLPGIVYQFYAKDNGEYGISYVGERLLEFFGVTTDKDTMFQLFVSRIHEEDRDGFMASLRKAIETRTTWNFEGRFIKPSGEVIWLQGLSTPTRHEDRLVFDGIMLNITERKQAEIKTAEAETLYRTLVNAVPDAVMVVDLEGRLKFASPKSLELLGFDTFEDAMGRSMTELVAPESIEDAKANLRRLVRGENVTGKEYILLKKNSAPFVAEIYSSFIRDDKGDIKEIIGYTRDITEHKRLEEEHRKLERKLSQSQKMDAIGQLAGGIAHDFNNILTGIQGNASLMMMQIDRENPHYKRLSDIKEQVKRGANLTRQLLGLAREGKNEVKTVSMNDLVRKSAQLFVETRKEIETEFQLHDNLYPVEADAGQIEQVLLNIYINAGHAMPAGGHLSIQTANVTLQEADARISDVKPGDYVKISISDTGTGMDAETLRRIFEPFFSTRTQEGGTGLGLASAYGIISNHGGIINAYSEPGQGATFNIYLPSSKKNVVKGTQTSQTVLFPGSGGVLLIDDEPTILDPTSKLLTMLGYAVYPAISGQEALAIYREKQGNIDLVILDMIMPVMTGSVVLKMLKEINKDVKVILSSGYSMRGEVQKVMEMGCCGFIQKPYNFAELSNVVHQTLCSECADRE